MKSGKSSKAITSGSILLRFIGSEVDFIGIHLPEVQWSFAVTETPKARDSIALSGFKATGAKKRDSVEN